MSRNGVLIAAGFALVLALVAANAFSNRGSPEPSETAPENITRPNGNPPPPVTAPQVAPGRTLAPGDGDGTGNGG